MKTEGRIEKECTLSDEELIQACSQWVHDLAKSGGKKWMLRIPVDFNRDPDMLFLELSKRFKLSKEQLKHVHNKAIDEAIERLSSYRDIDRTQMKEELESLKH